MNQSNSIEKTALITKPPGSISSCGEEPEKDLRGAAANWGDSGRGSIDVNGHSPLTTLLLNGTTDTNIDFHVIVQAKIGAYNMVLYDEIVPIQKNQQIQIPSDVQRAMNLHHKQYEYVTRIYGKAIAMSQDESINGAVERFEERYLAFNEAESYFEVMDNNTKSSVYPHGFTTQQGQTMAMDA